MKCAYVLLLLSVGATFADPPAEEWVTRYNGSSNSPDYARAIAVDENGNVFVTGESVDTEYVDCTTVMYNSSGVEQWVQRYNGPGNHTDSGRAIAVDENGSVYVTGYSVCSDINTDFVTIKYDIDGIEQWLVRYNGPGNSNDSAWAISLDDSGNVYIFGYSTGVGTESDYTVIKYNNDGVEQWNMRYNGPGNNLDIVTAGTLDSSGNVYVTGWSEGDGTDCDYATVKYSNDGVEQWVARFDGPESKLDQARDIAVDEAGNVYVTGASRSGFSSATEDYATVKYNSSGIEQWVQIYNGTANSYDQAFAVGLDELGNVYVTGYSWSSGTGWDYVTIKYDSNGVEQWVTSYNGPGNDIDASYAGIVDNSGNVYVTGSSTGTSGNYDYATVKYNCSGVEQWVQRYVGPIDGIEQGTAITFDEDGNVYVTGYSEGDGTSYDYATIKYSQPVDTALSEEIELGTLQLFPIEPNPSFDSFTINYYIPNVSEIKVDIYDLSGKLIIELANGECSTGSHQVQMSNQPSGVYFCHLQAGSISLTEKFVIIR